MQSFDIARRLTAEALGTAFLVGAVIGSGIMAAKLSGGNDALALLCNTLATGAMLVVIITILAPVSGAHFNPVVSLVMAIRGELGACEAVAYILVQIVGGCLGAFFAHLMFGLDPFPLSTRHGRGCRNGLPSLSPPSGFCLPFSAAFASNLTRWRSPSASTSHRPIGSRRRRPSPIPP